MYKKGGGRQEEPIVIFACICVRNPKSYIKLKMLSPVLGMVENTGWVGAVEGNIMHLVPFLCFSVLSYCTVFINNERKNGSGYRCTG